jgi:tetratricopeptide (TPR) repeat protein
MGIPFPKKWLSLSGACIFFLTAVGFSQTFDVNGSQKSENQNQKGSTNLGWGSSIEVARKARAAEDALKKNDYAGAVNYAEQAANSAPQNADLWFLLGYSARMAGRNQLSLDSYQRGLRLSPNSLSGLAGLAQTYAKMGRRQEAEPLLMKVVQSSGKDANTLALAGELLLNADLQKAAELLRRAEAIQPSAHTELLLARAYQNLNQPDTSKQFLGRARNRAPHDPDVLRAVAAVYRDNGQYDEAISSLESIPEKNPDTLAELAYTYQLAGKSQQAADLYTKAAKAARGNIGLVLSAAQSLIAAGQTEAARNFLERARTIDPNNYRLHAILAQIAESENRQADAQNEYESALAHLPAMVPEGPLYPIQLHLNLYELYTQQGNVEGAKKQLDLASAQLQEVQAPSQAEFLRLRAAVETASGNLSAADKDLKDALTLEPKNVNSLLSHASVLWKLGRKEDARKLLLQASNLDPHNRAALTSLGFLSRDMGDVAGAEDYFKRAAELSPRDFAPHLALGDLYASQRNFKPAEIQYEAAYQRVRTNPLVIAGGTNAALEAHDLPLAKRWLDRADAGANENPHVMRERQRYLTWTGKYQEAAQLGRRVIEALPRDQEGAVYLAYDLYYLGQYDEAFRLATKYDSILQNNGDLALIMGYVHVRSKQLPEALADFTHAVERDTTMATGYANRGYVLNDLREAAKAVPDFETALRLKPDYGEAHLGLAFAELQLHLPQRALEQLEMAKKSVGEIRQWHLARAEAFRQEQKFSRAEPEYRAALQQAPNDFTTLLTLSDVLYRMRRYNESLKTLESASKIDANQPTIYALMAQNYAALSQRQQALRAVDDAERYGKGQVDILMATGDALLSLGDQDAAMQRFSQALDAPGGGRVGIRLAIAQIFLHQGRWDDAQRQIALAFAEARAGDAPEVTAEDYIEAANIFLAMHEFDLATTYFGKARQAGGNERAVSLGMANTYLAEGDTKQAGVELGRLGDPNSYKDDYDYMMTTANLYRESRNTARALSTFAQAGSLAGQSDTAVQTAQYELAGQEGREITPKVSLFSNALFTPALEDITVYMMDAKLLGATAPQLLPTPRHSFQSIGEEHYRLHLHGLPTIEGFVGEDVARGRLSFPSISVIQDRNTYDTMFNGGVAPTVHLGQNTIGFNAGLQFTVRRDTISPVFMNQNLFRQFLYMSTSSFFNWISVNGSITREAGPFTEQALHSRDAAGNLEFTVGRPWGRTALLAGYFARDLLFRPTIREYYTTSTYVGLQRKFGSRLTAAILGEYVRSWRVEGVNWTYAQAMLPGARFEFRASPRWNVQGSFILSRGEGYHAYDNAHSQLLISYMRPMRRKLADGTEASVSYPARFSFGIEQQTFYNFTGQSATTILPVVHFTLF